MARSYLYQQQCPVARALDLVGEKWALLIVRDLLPGPQRFSDLLASLGTVTPKWLTQRLRELEEAGIVARAREEGRREVWYRLTPAGNELAPVVEALAFWGSLHGRPGDPADVPHPGRLLLATVVWLNRRATTPSAPVSWLLRLATDPPQADRLTFDAQGWWGYRGEGAADLAVETTPDAWDALLAAPPATRGALLRDMRIAGPPDRVQELVSIVTGPSRSEQWART